MSAVLHRPVLAVPVSERDHVLGPATAPVTLIEYGDYECPYCRAAQPILKQIKEIMGDDLRLAYRHFPLSQIHPHAYQAAEAAEAAGAQGRFWEMHDLLFANQDRLGSRDLIGLRNHARPRPRAVRHRPARATPTPASCARTS